MPGSLTSAGTQPADFFPDVPLGDHVFYVLAGTMSVLVGIEWIEASTGSFVVVPGNVTDDFENRGPERAGVLNVSAPAASSSACRVSRSGSLSILPAIRVSEPRCGWVPPRPPAPGRTADEPGGSPHGAGREPVGVDRPSPRLARGPAIRARSSPRHSKLDVPWRAPKPECRWRVLRWTHDQATPPGPSRLSAISDPYSDYGPAGRSSKNK